LNLETIAFCGKKTLQTIDTRVKALKARENGAFEEIEYFTNYSHRSTIKKDNPDSFFFQKADTTAKATKAPKKSKENKEPKKEKEPKPKKEKKSKIDKKKWKNNLLKAVDHQKNLTFQI